MFNLNFSSPTVLVSFIPLVLWTLFAILALMFSNKNAKVIQSLPSGFTATGVLGTFIGIFLGLQNFDVEDIQGSISVLLEGLKSSFSTSIGGIILSIFSGLLINIFQKREESAEKRLPQILDRLSMALEKLSDPQNVDSTSGHLMKIEGHFATMNASIIKWRDQAHLKHDATNDFLKNLDNTLTQFPGKIEENTGKLEKSIENNLEKVTKAITDSNKDLSTKIADMNAKGLLEAMERSVEIFNSRMEDMLARLVKENFQALNQSVQQLNTWQAENKTIVDDLLNKITIVLNTNQITSQELSTSAKAIHQNLAGARDQLGNSAESLTRLVAENGKLQLVLKELEKVALGDNNFKALIDSSAKSVEKLTLAMNGQRELNSDLIARYNTLQQTLLRVTEHLNKLASLGDINDTYWKGIRSSMEEMMGILTNATTQMSSALLEIDDSFRKNLAGVFQNLDVLIQNFAQNHINNGQPRR